MMTLRAALAHALLPRYASGRLAEPWASWVKQGIAEDASLTEAYTALRRAEQVAAGRALSAGQRDLVEGALFAALASADGAQADRARAVWSPPGRRALPLLAAVACIGAFFIVQPRDDAFGAGDLAARGAALARDPLGVKVSCVVDERVVDSATAGARRGSDALACPAGALLAFSLTNLSPEARHVFVIGVAPDGAPRFYAPFERDAQAVRVAAGTRDEVLPVLGDTRGMPADERVSLHVLLSDRPFSATDIERQLAGAQRRGAPLASLEKLPLPDVPLQARVDMVRP